MNKKSIVAILATATACAMPAAAQAHVTLQPSAAPAGAFTRLDVRVPNERDNASTTKVTVRFPPGFIFVSYEPVRGWSTKVAMAKLATPVDAHGEQHTEQVSQVTFTATAGGIAPGQFQDFGLSVGLPDKPGTALTFKALQTYSNGEVVRWIGPPDADEPAPQVTLTAAQDPAAGGHQAAAAPAASDDADGDGGGNGLALAALVVGVAGLLFGGGALLLVARRGGSRASA